MLNQTTEDGASLPAKLLSVAVKHVDWKLSQCTNFSDGFWSSVVCLIARNGFGPAGFILFLAMVVVIVGYVWKGNRQKGRIIADSSA